MASKIESLQNPNSYTIGQNGEIYYFGRNPPTPKTPKETDKNKLQNNPTITNPETGDTYYLGRNVGGNNDLSTKNKPQNNPTITNPETGDTYYLGRNVESNIIKVTNNSQSSGEYENRNNNKTLNYSYSKSETWKSELLQNYSNYDWIVANVPIQKDGYIYLQRAKNTTGPVVLPDNATQAYNTGSVFVIKVRPEDLANNPGVIKNFNTLSLNELKKVSRTAEVDIAQEAQDAQDAKEAAKKKAILENYLGREVSTEELKNTKFVSQSEFNKLKSQDIAAENKAAMAEAVKQAQYGTLTTFAAKTGKTINVLETDSGLTLNTPENKSKLIKRYQEEIFKNLSEKTGVALQAVDIGTTMSASLPAAEELTANSPLISTAGIAYPTSDARVATVYGERKQITGYEDSRLMQSYGHELMPAMQLAAAAQDETKRQAKESAKNIQAASIVGVPTLAGFSMPTSDARVATVTGKDNQIAGYEDSRLMQSYGADLKPIMDIAAAAQDETKRQAKQNTQTEVFGTISAAKKKNLIETALGKAETFAVNTLSRGQYNSIVEWKAQNTLQAFQDPYLGGAANLVAAPVRGAAKLLYVGNYKTDYIPAINLGQNTWAKTEGAFWKDTDVKDLGLTLTTGAIFKGAKAGKLAFELPVVKKTLSFGYGAVAATAAEMQGFEPYKEKASQKLGELSNYFGGKIKEQESILFNSTLFDSVSNAPIEMNNTINHKEETNSTNNSGNLIESGFGNHNYVKTNEINKLFAIPKYFIFSVGNVSAKFAKTTVDNPIPSYLGLKAFEVANIAGTSVFSKFGFSSAKTISEVGIGAGVIGSEVYSAPMGEKLSAGVGTAGLLLGGAGMAKGFETFQLKAGELKAKNYEKQINEKLSGQIITKPEMLPTLTNKDLSIELRGRPIESVTGYSVEAIGKEGSTKRSILSFNLGELQPLPKTQPKIDAFVIEGIKKDVIEIGTRAKIKTKAENALIIPNELTTPTMQRIETQKEIKFALPKDTLEINVLKNPAIKIIEEENLIGMSKVNLGDESIQIGKRTIDYGKRSEILVQNKQLLDAKLYGIKTKTGEYGFGTDIVPVNKRTAPKDTVDIFDELTGNKRKELSGKELKTYDFQNPSTGQKFQAQQLFVFDRADIVFDISNAKTKNLRSWSNFGMIFETLKSSPKPSIIGKESISNLKPKINEFSTKSQGNISVPNPNLNINKDGTVTLTKTMTSSKPATISHAVQQQTQPKTKSVSSAKSMQEIFSDLGSKYKKQHFQTKYEEVYVNPTQIEKFKDETRESVKSETKQNISPLVSLNQNPNQSQKINMPILSQFSSQRQFQGQKILFSDFQRQHQKQNTMIAESKQHAQAQTIAQKQRQQQKTKYMELEVSRQKYGFEAKNSIMERELSKEDRPSIIPYINHLTQITPEKVQGYNAEVYEKKRWLKANRKPLDEFSALDLSLYIIDNSAAATCRITKSKQKVIPRLRSRAAIMQNMNKYRASRSNTRTGRVYVEKNTYRIDTPGELNQITAKGLIAQMRKNRMMGF